MLKKTVKVKDLTPGCVVEGSRYAATEDHPERAGFVRLLNDNGRVFKIIRKTHAVWIDLDENAMSANMRSLRDDLRALLGKYNATIEVGYDDSSDMHGVTGEDMALVVDDWTTSTSERLCIKYGWDLDAADLKTRKNS